MLLIHVTLSISKKSKVTILESSIFKCMCPQLVSDRFLFESLIIKFGEGSILEKWLVIGTKVSTYILGHIYLIDVIVNIQKMHS
jgi:hypothetical protein